MRRWYKILTICLVLLGAVLLGGCTKRAQLNSEMTVEEDGSGIRTIQIEMDKSLVRKGFKGSQKTVERLMDQYCPEELEWSVKEQKTLYNLTLTLSFDTLEEYAEKAKALVGENKIVLEDTGKGLSVGFSLEEQVTAEDFLKWMKDALVKEKYIKSREKDDLFRLQKTYFSYAGKRQVVQNGKIRYQAQKDYDAEQMVLLTRPDPGEQWSRIIYICFPSELMQRREEQVQGFIEDRIGQETQAEWLSQTCVRLTFPPDDVYGLAQSMKLFFGQTSCKIEETMEPDGVFSFRYQYEEYMDVSDFASDTGKVPVYYYVKDSADGNMTYRSGEEKRADVPAMPESGSQEVQSQIETAIESDGYQMVFGQSLERKSVFYDMDCHYGAKAIEVSNVMKDSRFVSRSITVAYDRVPSSAHQSAIKQDFETKVGQSGYVEILEEDGEFGVRVSQEGTWEELAGLFETVYGGKDQVSYKRDKTTLLTPSANGYMEEDLDFSNFLPEGCEPQITYAIQFESGDTILKDTLDSTAQKADQEQVIKSNRYTATVGGDGFHIKFTTKIKNLISMPLISLIIFVAAAALIWYLHGARWQRIMLRVAPVYETCRERAHVWWEERRESVQGHRDALQKRWKDGILKIKDKRKDGKKTNDPKK